MAAQALDWDAMDAVLRIYEEQVPYGILICYDTGNALKDDQGKKNRS